MPDTQEAGAAMKCPFKFKLMQFEGGEECDERCAWLLRERRPVGKPDLGKCAVAAAGEKSMPWCEAPRMEITNVDMEVEDVEP